MMKDSFVENRFDVEYRYLFSMPNNFTSCKDMFKNRKINLNRAYPFVA